MRKTLPAALSVLALMSALISAQDRPASQSARPPIIDMHLHAVPMTPQPIINCGSPLQEWAPRDGRATFHRDEVRSLCDHPVVAPKTDAEYEAQTFKYLDEYNITGVLLTSPQMGAAWKKKAPRPERLILGTPGGPAAPLAQLRKLFASGEMHVMGETGVQGQGMGPDHVQMEPYWALAEELDIPVGYHMGLSGAGSPYTRPGSAYYAALTNPLLLEPVLRRHPRLRVYVMHASWPLIDEMIAVMYSHPQVYVDTSMIDWGIPRKEFHTFLKRLVEAGFGQRVMFGSDQFVWPEGIPLAVQGIESADFLTEAQKRDVFYNNAARFLRLKTPTTNSR